MKIVFTFGEIIPPLNINSLIACRFFVVPEATPDELAKIQSLQGLMLKPAELTASQQEVYSWGLAQIAGPWAGFQKPWLTEEEQALPQYMWLTLRSS